MSDQIIVIQASDDVDAGVQVSYFNTLEEATLYIELCLEAGCGRDNISPYRATRLKMQITQRPVVSLEPGPGVPIPPEYAVDGYEESADGERIPRLASNDYTPRPA